MFNQNIISESAPVPKSLQYIPPVPGYIPVYIRKGDTPLEEINLQLAEAFRSLETKTAHQKPQTALQSQLADISKEIHHKKVTNNVIHKEKELIIPVVIQTGYTEEEKKKIFQKKLLAQANSHIQKIPKKY